MSSIRPDRRDRAKIGSSSNLAFADLVPNSRTRDNLASDAIPYGWGSAADVQRRRAPVEGENAEHLEMAASLILRRPLKIIVMLSAESV